MIRLSRTRSGQKELRNRLAAAASYKRLLVGRAQCHKARCPHTSPALYAILRIFGTVRTAAPQIERIRKLISRRQCNCWRELTARHRAAYRVGTTTHTGWRPERFLDFELARTAYSRSRTNRTPSLPRRRFPPPSSSRHDSPRLAIECVSDEDAAAQLSILRAISPSDLHNLVYRSDYRIVPAVTATPATPLDERLKAT